MDSIVREDTLCIELLMLRMSENSTNIALGNIQDAIERVDRSIRSFFSEMTNKLDYLNINLTVLNVLIGALVVISFLRLLREWNKTK